jgi:hypothetical protein
LHGRTSEPSLKSSRISLEDRLARLLAQIKNLWRFAPVWVRVLAWVLIIYAVVTTVWNWIT